jgi:hypothetical protein
MSHIGKIEIFDGVNWGTEVWYDEPVRRRKIRDWHIKWQPDEPLCRKRQWRKRDRYDVINMRDMDDKHLGHAIRFATTKAAHTSRLSALLAERLKRNKGK